VSKIDVGLTTSVAALAGGVLWGMANIFSIVFAPKPPARRDVVRAIVGSLFALVAAVIGGAMVAPWIVRHNGVSDVESITLIGLFVGMGFWAAVPMTIVIVSRLLPAMFGNVGSALINAAEAAKRDDPEEPKS
jgi:MFS family permease